MTKQIPSWMVQYKEEAEFQDKIIKGSIEYTNKTKEQWAKEYPELLSVYVCRGSPGDPLIIGDTEYVLVNNFLAATIEQVMTGIYSLETGSIQYSPREEITRVEHVRVKKANNIKLTEQQAKEILSLKGTEPSTVVAKRYNIHCSTVCYIWEGTLWRYL